MTALLIRPSCRGENRVFDDVVIRAHALLD